MPDRPDPAASAHSDLTVQARAKTGRDDGQDGMARLRTIMARLRDPEDGCPWDLTQDFASIAPYTIEEAYEVADAIERRDWNGLRDELGDLLLQCVFHSRLAEEAGLFDLDQVAEAICAKMIARHPHVFGDESGDKNAAQQSRDWEALKARERASAGATGTLAGIARTLPALTRAVKLQKRAARVGFDWPSTDEVLAKIVEEARELVEARDRRQAEETFEEFGDLLFVMVNLGRHLGLDPEAALRGTNEKFTRRFNYIEDELKKRGKTPDHSDLAEMDALWNQAKRAEKAAAASD